MHVVSNNIIIYYISIVVCILVHHRAVLLIEIHLPWFTRDGSRFVLQSSTLTIVHFPYLPWLKKDADSGSDLVDAFLSDAYLNTEELRKDGPFSPDEFLVSKRFLGLDGLVNELSRLFEQVNNELMLLVKDNYQDFVHLGSRMKSGNTKVSTLISSIHRSEEQLKVIQITTNTIFLVSVY